MFIDSIHSTIEFTRNGVTVFSGIGSLIPGETRLLGARVGLGYAEIAGIAVVTAAAPAIVAGSLTVEQSVDGSAWDQVDTFAMTLASGVLPFAVKIVGKYIRVQFTVAVGEVYDVRFGAHLNSNQQT